MKNKLCFFVCNSYAPEIEHILASKIYADAAVQSFPSQCSGNHEGSDPVEKLFQETCEKYSNAIFLGSVCSVKYKKLQAQSGQQTETGLISRLRFGNCFELFLSRSLVEHYTEHGAYLITSGRLRNYRQLIQEWGFEPDHAKRFFGESLRSVLLLETGIYEDYNSDIQALSDYMGLPYEVLPVGLDHCTHLLDSLINEWRFEKERLLSKTKISEISSRTADYQLVFHEINALVDLIEEKDIVQRIFSLLNLLFAPQCIKYTPLFHDRPAEPVFTGDKAAQLPHKENSFSIQLFEDEHLIGMFEIFSIAFPDYIEKYKEISRIIGRISGLAVSNARKFQILTEDKEKLSNYAEELETTNEELRAAKDEAEYNLNQSLILFKQLSEAKVQLERLNSEKDKFFSIIAHDLKSPFHGLLGIANLLHEKITTLPQQELALFAGLLKKTVDGIYALLQNLLEWSQMQRNTAPFQPRSILAKAFLNEITLLIKNQADQKSIIINVLASQTLEVFADEKMLSSVLRNLLSNAVKFTFTNGMVTVRIREINDGMVLFSVSDTGMGMPPEILNNLFKIEEKTGRKGTSGEESTGLGLLLCKEFVQKHGGTIRAESVEGNGSTFYFTMPRRFVP